MATLESLRSQGWHLSSEGLSKLCENESTRDVKNITRKALNVDLRDIGIPIIASELTKDVFGPAVLQILKIKNVSASKAKPKSQTAPRMLKLSLTDGHINCQGIEMKQIPSLNLDNTVPGTKVIIDGAQILSGCLLLDINCCKVLGGLVPALVDKWEVAKLMPSHIRVNEDGPPAWVNFGKKIITNLNNQGFKSLENKNKENTKEDAEFQNLRQDAISEAAQGAVKKVFGGGVKTPQTFSSNEPNSNYNNSNNRASRPIRNKGREKTEPEKIEKPSQRVSLFDFLEDKLPATEIQPKNNSTNVKIYNEFKKPQYDNFMESKDGYNKYKPQNKYNQDRFENSSRGGSGNRYQNDRNKFTNDRRDFENKPGVENRYQPNKYNSDRKEIDNRQENTTNRYQNDRPTNKFNNEHREFDPRSNTDTRYQSDRPPRFQKQRNDAKFPGNPSETRPDSKFQNNPREFRSKPDTNHFINKLANEINYMSLYNSRFENEKINKPSNNETAVDETTTWRWKTGDRCMAKYWEDNKFYNAVVTGVTNKTCMVEFLEYGNFEEVLHCDCIPVTAEKEEQQINKPFVDNQQFPGNLEFRRGKNRPFVRNQTKSALGNRTYES